MKRARNIIWGLVLVAVGLVWGLNVMGLTDITIFFDGWWTLFIIIPCAIGLVTEHDKMGNLIGLVIGVALLLACQDILEFSWLWKLLIPALVVVFGLKLIFKDTFRPRIKEIEQDMKASGANMKVHCAIFSGQDANYSGERFEGAELNAIFGGAKCDLRNAIIERDVVINSCSVFGGVEILVPSNVNIKVSSTCIFGGISDKRPVKTTGNPVTIYINATCIFGGSEIK